MCMNVCLRGRVEYVCVCGVGLSMCVYMNVCVCVRGRVEYVCV